MTAKSGSFVIHWKRPDKRVVETLNICSVSYTHLTLPTTPYV